MLNLFPEKKVPYFIVAPGWTHKSSGVRALHLLCHALNEIGQKAYLVPYSESFSCNTDLNTPLATAVSCSWETAKECGLDRIVIYPDIIRGNPLNAEKVVRWLLAPAGAYGGDKDFPKTDMVYGYTKDIAEPSLCVPTFDYRIFYDSPLPRSGEVFYSHKYDRIHRNTLLPLTANARRLEGTQTEIADMLRAAKLCYVYERSEIFVLARLCGCPVFPIVTSYWDGRMPEEFKDHNINSLHMDLEKKLRVFVERTQTWQL